MKLAFPDWDEDIPNWVFEFPSAIPALNNRINEIFERNFYPTCCHSRTKKLFYRTSSFTA
uniref:Uncharacterized protein n=1 Tax=Oryza punctata TaxID=4537 RepID=A0A0E0JNM0_ORYPU